MPNSNSLDQDQVQYFKFWAITTDTLAVDHDMVVMMQVFEDLVMLQAFEGPCYAAGV